MRAHTGPAWSSPCPFAVTVEPRPLPRDPWTLRFVASVRRFFRNFLREPVDVLVTLVPFAFLSVFLFTRSPRTNFIFDEQEALLANPYVRDAAVSPHKYGWLDAFTTDFWGRKPEGTIGSYRPLPNLLWRALWWLGAREQSPFFHHWLNVLGHGLNAALLSALLWRYSRRRDVAWLSGLFFCTAGVATECIAGVVGLADVLSVTGFLAALHALRLRGKLLPLLPLAIFASTMMSLLAKESGLSLVPLLPLAALLLARGLHPRAPYVWLRAAMVAVGAVGAFVLYVEGRRRLFPVPVPAEFTVAAVAEKSKAAQNYAAIMRWYGQPALPKDALNNPLAFTDAPHRIAGALRVYVRGLTQILFPWTLSGDYSAPQEPAPSALVFPESVLGALALIGPPIFAIGLAIQARLRARHFLAPVTLPKRHAVGAQTLWTVERFQTRDLRPMLALAWLTIVLFYFPVSNIPIPLPTVRAERFLYPCLLGTSVLLAAWGALLLRHAAKPPAGEEIDPALPAKRPALLAARGLLIVFVLFQGICARRHANDYSDDLAFWDSARKAVPNSAKAHLNYSVMLGARSRPEERLVENQVAVALAPTWPMAHVYLGDTLCRMHRAPEAVPHYLRGFPLAANDKPLLALGLQCLWDEKQLVAGAPLRETLVEEAKKTEKPTENSWYNWLVADLMANGEKNNGIDPKSRPRSYNEGPRE